MADIDRDKIYADFTQAVNMTPAAIEKFLETDDSKRVGFKHTDGAESVGHKSGKRIVEILHATKGDLTDDDYAHMKKVVGYVNRHMAQGPAHETSNWRYSLMNWGHDPLNK